MKKAKDFAIQSAGDSFKLEEALGLEEKAARNHEKIVLEIGRSKEKIKLNTKKGSGKTGNVFLDTYKKVNDVVINMNRIKVHERAVFFRLLAVMVDAGIPIIRSLQTLSEQNKKNPKFERIIAEMAVNIEEGESLSVAMSHYEGTFSESEIGMINSGEISGHLNDVLRDLAKQTEKSSQTLRKVKGALTYPAVVMAILFIVLFLMMILVIPQITKLFTQSNAELPGITKFVIGLSGFLKNNVIAILVGTVAFIGLFIAWTKTKSGRYHWHAALLHFPIIGPLIQKSQLSQFARALGSLLGSGVSIIQSIKIISNSLTNEVYKRKVAFSGEDIKTGIPLAETLKNTPYFPVMFVNMIEIGEKTAQLETVCKRISKFYDEQVDDAVKGLTKVIEPVIMIFVGAAVGGLVASIMLPIMSLSNVAGGI